MGFEYFIKINIVIKIYVRLLRGKIIHNHLLKLVKALSVEAHSLLSLMTVCYLSSTS